MVSGRYAGNALGEKEDVRLFGYTSLFDGYASKNGGSLRGNL